MQVWTLSNRSVVYFRHVKLIYPVIQFILRKYAELPACSAASALRHRFERRSR